MSESDLSVFAHLMRRAGFGAVRSELDGLAAKGYESVVEDLINPERLPEFEVDLESRYFGNEGRRGAGGWIYRMVNNRRQLEEKMALFWHHVFATSEAKGAHNYASNDQIDLFRRVGLSDLRTILIELSKDPAMIFWLDNNENRRDEPNENYGRELLELFSMGVGNYTEEDVKMCARAFTGWTFAQAIPFYPHGRYPVDFVFRDDDHDYGEKAFLGETGRFNGEDIIDIIVKQPATARFISRHLYSFFVADEPHVAAWNDTPPQDQEAIETLVEGLFRLSGGDPLDASGAVQLRLLQGCQAQEGQEPYGAGGRHHQAGGYLPPARAGPGRLLRGRCHCDGPEAAVPSHSGGLAHRPRVDRWRHPKPARQFRR